MRLRRRAPLEDGLLLAAPLITLILVITYVSRHEFAVDFQHQFWVAGHRLLVGGMSPYAWSHAQIASGVGAFPYPALAALLFVPFALIPTGVAAALWVLISMVAVIATLRVLAVRDWRLYALAFLWWPVIIAWQSGNLTLVLGLLLALIWRYRDRPIIAGLLVALAVSLKPFMWPAWLWLLATRRYRAAAAALGGGLVLNLAAWGIIGFDQLNRYIHLDSQVTSALYHYGYGVIAMLVRAGADRTAGTAVMIAVSLGLVAACLQAGRRSREAPALLLAVLLMLAASPLTWNHYLALLIVPLAILRPRLSPEWLIPLVLWLCPGGLRVAEWQALLFLLIVALVSYMLLRRAPATGAASAVRTVKASQERRASQAHVLATAQGGERAG